MASLLSNPDELRKMGDQGRKAVLEDYSMDQMAKNIAGIYSDVARA